MAVDTWHASAPGKVILFGEHAVVHGHVALAASVDLRTTASLQCASHRTPPPEPNKTHLSLHIPSFGIHCQWLPSDLSNAVRETEGEASLEVIPRRVHGCSDELLSRLRFMAESQIFTASLPSMTGGVTAFLFLYCRLLGSSPADVSVTTELPVGAGLGSSAAFCVAVSTVLLAKAGVIGEESLDFPGKNEETKAFSKPETLGGKRTRDWTKPRKEDLALVNSWAYEGEKILHGNPSGVDNSVSTYGHMLRFQNGGMEHLLSRSPLRILLTDTCVPRNTKALVKAVRDRLLRHPQAMGAILSAIHEIAFEAFSLLQSEATECANRRSETTITKEEKTGSDIPEDMVLGTEREKSIDGTDCIRVQNGVSASRSFEKANVGRHHRENCEPENGSKTGSKTGDMSKNEASNSSLSLSESVSGAERDEPDSQTEGNCGTRTEESPTDKCQTPIGPQKRLEEMVQISQGLLDAIGVGHPAISAVCRVTASHGLQSKLTGAGGGGCVLTFLPPHVGPEKVEKLKTELEGLGYVNFEVVVGGEGVLVQTV